MLRQRIAERNQRRGQASRPSAREVPIPLPLRGIFVKAKTAQVANLYAAQMTNLRSNGVSLTLRPGLSWADGGPSQVQQRIPFEFNGVSAYISLTPTGATCQSHSFSRPFNGKATWGAISGNVIIADGLSLPLRYDGTEFRLANFTAEVGPNPATCDGFIAHHDRAYFWKTDGPLEFLYGDVGAVQGPLQRFPLGRLGNVTGSIKSMLSLTIDAGHGMNDALCIITSTGQMVLYEGLDPSDAGDWRLLARVQGAKPIGNRSFAQVGSDAWMLTPQGIVSVAEAVRSSVLALVSDITQPISDEITALVEAGPADWQMFTAADGSMVVINRVANGEASQFIYYMESRSWATANFPARDFHNLNGRPEVTGLDGRVGSMWHTGSDEVISAEWVSSWFQVGSGAAVKYLEPTIISSGPMTVSVAVLSDNNDTPADIAEAVQTITLEPEEGNAVRVTLSEVIPTDASGKTFQIRLGVTARWAEITGLMAAIGS